MFFTDSNKIPKKYSESKHSELQTITFPKVYTTIILETISFTKSFFEFIYLVCDPFSKIADFSINTWRISPRTANPLANETL